MVKRAIASVGAHTNVLRIDETETVVLCVCVTMSQEDMIFLMFISMFMWLV